MAIIDSKTCAEHYGVVIDANRVVMIVNPSYEHELDELRQQYAHVILIRKTKATLTLKDVAALRDRIEALIA